MEKKNSKYNKIIPKLFITGILIIILSSCSGEKNTSQIDTNPTQEIINSDDFIPITGPPPMPHIFNGKFTIKNKPGPKGVTIFAQIIDGGSPISVTNQGSYMHIILSPVSERDLDHGIFHFYIGSREGEYIEADQRYNIKSITNPTVIELDLNFSRLPGD